MAQSFFVWNGTDCRSMGVVMRGPAPIVRPEERVQHVEIPGRSGDLTRTEGENIYNSYIQTAGISVRGGYRAREVFRWLRGSGYVTFSGEPEKRQPARIIGAITLNRHSYNADWWNGEVQFYCQPLKEPLQEEKITISASGTDIRNDGDVISHPLYKVTASGSEVSLSVSGNGTPEENAITVTEMESGWIIWIDSETMEVWNTDRTELITRASSGNFPVLAPGVNTVSGSGWSAIEIEKRERYL